jgi:hypothetical protein
MGDYTIAINIILIISVSGLWYIGLRRTEKAVSSRPSNTTGLELVAFEDVISKIRQERTEEIAQIKFESALLIQETKRECEVQIARLREEHARIQDAMQVKIDFLLDTVAKGSPIKEITRVADHEQISTKDILVVIGGSELSFKTDLVAIRRSGMRTFRLMEPSKKALVSQLERKRRSDGFTYKYLHISAHAGPEGIQIGNDIADPEWLADNLNGIEILLIAGCDGEELGDWLGGIARYVITMSEPVKLTDEPAQSDIGIFTEAFWKGIGNGYDVYRAFDKAISLSPVWIGEIAQIHSGVNIS